MYIVKVCKAVIHIVDFNLSGFYRKQELLFFSGIKRKINSHYCDKGVKTHRYRYTISNEENLCDCVKW